MTQTQTVYYPSSKTTAIRTYEPGNPVPTSVRWVKDGQPISLMAVISARNIKYERIRKLSKN